MKNPVNVPFLKYQVWGYVLALGVACTPEQCQELEGVCRAASGAPMCTPPGDT